MIREAVKSASLNNMARIVTISSGSDANGYIIETSNETLLIELGCKWNDILKALDYKLEKVCGCLCSHSHGDHLNPSTLKNALKSGLSVFSNESVAEVHKGVRCLRKGLKMRIGEDFAVQPIPLKHSVENYGFLIEHPEIGRVIFATDCESFPYKIKDVNHILLEANYSEDKIIDNLCDNQVLRSQYENHLSIDDSIEALKKNYSPSLQTILLLHLSSQNSDSEGFKKQVQESLGFSNVLVADKNLEIPINIDEF